MHRMFTPNFSPLAQNLEPFSNYFLNSKKLESLGEKGTHMTHCAALYEETDEIGFFRAWLRVKIGTQCGSSNLPIKSTIFNLEKKFKRVSRVVFCARSFFIYVTFLSGHSFCLFCPLFCPPGTTRWWFSSDSSASHGSRQEPCFVVARNGVLGLHAKRQPSQIVATGVIDFFLSEIPWI